MTDVKVDRRSERSHRGWSIRVGSPEGYTSLESVPGAPPDLVSQVAELMADVSEAEDTASPDPSTLV